MPNDDPPSDTEGNTTKTTIHISGDTNTSIKLKSPNKQLNKEVLRIFANEIHNKTVAKAIRNQLNIDQTKESVWKDHNKYEYEPPEKVRRKWTENEIKHLIDRHIDKQTIWVCQECDDNKQFSDIEQARKHMESTHSQHLLDEYALDPEEKELPDTNVDEEELMSEEERKNKSLQSFIETGTTEV